jgi:hypothetical protein
MKRNVVVLAEAANDIERGIDFYNAIEDGVGLYFRDSNIAIALSSQVTAWQVRDTVEQRAKRGASSDLGAILAAVPDVPPVSGDEK